MTLDLNTLISPMSCEDFLESHWPDTLLSVPASEERYYTLTSAVPELASAESLMKRYPSEVRLVNTEGFHATVPNGPSAIPFYHQGFTCYLRNVERVLPPLANMLDTVASQLAVPRQDLITEIWCSSGSSGVSMHGDYDINFAIQVYGDKHWRVAPNENIRNPVIMCLPEGQRQRSDRQLLFADSLPLPDRMPDKAVDLHVGQGGLTFLPRGWWHETKASGDCLQLNVALKGPHWLKVLTEGLVETLVGDAGWREFAFGLNGDKEQRDAALSVFAARLSTLRSLLDVEDMPAMLELARSLATASGYLPSEVPVGSDDSSVRKAPQS